MSTRGYLFSGFGGQGILFAGKLLAYKGLIEEKQVSWLPSYGPEMRGGTASCGVIVSDEPVGSPIVSHPDVLVAMNLPSLDRYESAVVSGGTVFYDSKLIYSLDRLTPERPLVVRMTFPGDTPTYGISYVDESGDGMKHNLIVEVSGEDGTLLLRETD